MATREENLKKINYELEKLSNDELEQIAGGILKYIDDSATEKFMNPDNDPTKLFIKPP